MRVLGIAGAKGVGKGTAASFVHEWAVDHKLIAVERGFADALKHSVCRLFYPECSLLEAIAWADKFKEIGRVTGAIGVSAEKVVDVTGRVFLQRAGTEAHRDVFGSSFWVDYLLPSARTDLAWNAYSGDDVDLAIIADVRFANEAQRVSAVGGEVWRISRPGHTSDGHASEVPLNASLVDVEIHNNATLDYLRDGVRKLCDQRFDVL